MELKVLSAKNYNVKLKATIQATGKLGFTAVTAKEMKLTAESGIKFAQDEKGQLYLINCAVCDDDSFRLYISGDYYSLNTTVLFNNLGYDYRNRKIIFDLVPVPEEGENIYRMVQRDPSGKKKSEQ